MTIEELLAAIAEGKEGLDVKGSINDLISSAVSGADTSLKTKNTDLLKQIRTLKDSSKMPDGFDEELWTTLLGEHQEKKTAKMKAEERWEELKIELVKKHQEEMDSSQTRFTNVEKALAEQLIDNAAMKFIGKAGGNAALLMPHVKAQLKMVENDGAYSTVVVDSNGENRFSKSKAGEMMSIEELVNVFKADESFGVAFSADNSGGGGGSQGTSGGGGVVNPFVKGTPAYNLTNQAKMRRSDPKLAEQMAARAQVLAQQAPPAQQPAQGSA